MVLIGIRQSFEYIFAPRNPNIWRRDCTVHRTKDEVILLKTSFIKQLKTPRGWYVYDVGKDALLKVSKEIYEALAIHSDATNSQLPESIKSDLHELSEMGYFSTNRPQFLRHPAMGILSVLLDRKIEKLTLQLTQDCNFRCKYCIYSEDINLKQRHHSQKRMSWDTAKAAIDFYRDHSEDADLWNIGFYGGEPLLEFKLLQRCIEYAESELKGKPLTFGITTNASLLKGPVVEFLKDHNVDILISLDGSRETHDRNRVFRDGSGTYEVIRHNLSVIKQLYPDYFEKIHYNMVVDCSAGIRGYQCILADIAVDSEHVNATLIENTDEPIKLNSEFVREIEYLKFVSFYEDAANIPFTGNTLSIGAIKDARHRIDIHDGLNGMPAVSYPGGQCIPGKTRLFVNVDGDLYPCERVNETQAMCIGNIRDGFNLAKIEKLLNVATITEEQCKNCWAQHLCTSCIKLADDGMGLSSSLRQAHCAEIKSVAYETLRTIVCLWECETIYANEMLKLKKENKHAESNQ